MKNLTIKQLTNISLLIAISVGLVYFGILLMGLSSIPNLRSGFAGIPVKMAGFIYGPVVGIVTGAISDILGLIVFPTFYHPGYTLDLMISGFIPGLVGLMYRKHTIGYRGLAITSNAIIVGVVVILISIFFELPNLGSALKLSIIMYIGQMIISLFILMVYIFEIKRESQTIYQYFDY